jgi:predicted RNase H-like nuclease
MSEGDLCVIGLDIGFSAKRRTSGFVVACLSSGKLSAIDGPRALTQAGAVDALDRSMRSTDVAAVAVGAPTATSVPSEYRPVERVFSLGRFQTLCKPGSSGSPIGRDLAEARHANLSAVAGMASYVPFDQLGSRRLLAPVVEAFPTATMAVFADPSELPATDRSDKTDRYFESLVSGADAGFCGVRLDADLRRVTNHEKRMAVICALVASWYLNDAYTAVGSAQHGYFLMPALSAWHPLWREELKRSLAREERASCVHGGVEPAFVEHGVVPISTSPTSGLPASDSQANPSPHGVVPLTPRSGRSRPTVQPGYVNRNQQEVIRATGLRGTDHGESIYVLRCGLCANEYGSNGTDNFQRKCPACQRGAPGLRY